MLDTEHISKVVYKHHLFILTRKLSELLRSLTSTSAQGLGDGWFYCSVRCTSGIGMVLLVLVKVLLLHYAQAPTNLQTFNFQSHSLNFHFQTFRRRL